MEQQQSRVQHQGGGGHNGVNSPPQPQSLSSADDWLEWVFFRVHTRCAAWMSRSFGAGSRRVFEMLCAVLAASGLALLVLLHRKYEAVTNLSTKLAAARLDFDDAEECSEKRIYAIQIIINAMTCNTNHEVHDEDQVIKRYWYSAETGIVELSDFAKRALDIPRRTVCLTEEELGVWLFRTAAGPDAIIANAGLVAFGPIGQLSIDGTLYRDLSLALHTKHWFLMTLSIALKTAFLLFSTSTLAAYTLRETQTRMLRFAFLIKQFVSNRQSYLQLVIAHLLDSIVFAPITLGMLSFLYEFFNDQLLALLILSLIWGYQLFAAISLRSLTAIRVLPHIIMFYLAALHFYIFSTPLGFHFFALFITLAFIGHAMFFFWNHFELPALLAGRVSPARPRAVYLSPPPSSTTTTASASTTGASNPASSTSTAAESAAVAGAAPQ